jgi:hypothetical protein
MQAKDQMLPPEYSCHSRQPHRSRRRHTKYFLKNSITLHDFSVHIEALNKSECATGK